MRGRRFRTSLGVVLTFALAACGGGGTSAREYVRSLCGATAQWQENVQQRTVALASDLGGDPSPQEGKAAFREYLDDILASTDTLVGRLEDAGTPDVENGEQAADRVISSLQRVRDAFEEARDQVDGLSTESPEAFEQGAEEIGQTITTSLQGIQDPIGQDDAELQAVFEDEPSCDKLQS
ncbi:MAG: hypothetical protein ABR518_09895 [Actinomycetota bacterium]